MSYPLSTRSAALGEEGSFVSASHCQNDSPDRIYNLVPRPFTFVGKLSKSSIEAISFYVTNYHIREFKGLLTTADNEFICAPILADGRPASNILRNIVQDGHKMSQIPPQILLDTNIFTYLDSIPNNSPIRTELNQDLEVDMFLLLQKVEMTRSIFKTCHKLPHEILNICQERYFEFIPKGVSKQYLLTYIYYHLQINLACIKEVFPTTTLDQDFFLEVTNKKLFDEHLDTAKALIYPYLVDYERSHGIVWVSYLNTDHVFTQFYNDTIYKEFLDKFPTVVKLAIHQYIMLTRVEMGLRLEKLIYDPQQYEEFNNKYMSIIAGSVENFVKQVEDETIQMHLLMQELKTRYRILDINVMSNRSLIRIIQSNFQDYYDYFINNNREDMFRKLIRKEKYILHREIFEILNDFNKDNYNSLNDEDKGFMEQLFKQNKTNKMNLIVQKAEQYINSHHPVDIVYDGFLTFYNYLIEGWSGIMLNRTLTLHTNISNYIIKMLVEITISIRRKLGQAFSLTFDSRVEIKRKYDLTLYLEHTSQSSESDSDEDTEILSQAESPVPESPQLFAEMELAPREPINQRIRRINKAKNDTLYSFLNWLTNGLRSEDQTQLINVLKYILSYREIGELSVLRDMFIDNGMGWYFVGDLDNSTEEDEFVNLFTTNMIEAAQSIFGQVPEFTNEITAQFINHLSVVNEIVIRKMNEYVSSHSLVETIYTSNNDLARYCLLNEREGVLLLTIVIVNLYKAMLKKTYSDAYTITNNVTNYVIVPELDDQDQAIEFYERYTQMNE